MKSLRVAVFYKRLINPGGAERHVVRECEFFERTGADVHLVSYEIRKEALFDYKGAQAEIVEGTGFSQFVSFIRLLRRIRPHVIITSYGLFEVYFASLMLGIPYIFYHHSPFLLYSLEPRDIPYALIHRRHLADSRNGPLSGRGLVPIKWPFGWKRRVTAETKAILDFVAVRRASLVVTYSHETAAEVLRIYRRPAIATRGGLDSAIKTFKRKLNIKEQLGIAGKQLILNVNRLSPEKRVDLLIDAFAQVRRTRDDVVLVIGGVGPLRKQLEAQVVSLGLGADVRFAGFIPESDVWEFYAACDVFASPAWADFALTPYEALALGRKVVWSAEMEPWRGETASSRVFPAEPEVSAFSAALQSALNARGGHTPPLDSYEWEAKFTPTYLHCQKLAATGKVTS